MSDAPLRFQPAATSERIERGTLVALAFVVPLFEFPKNLLCVAFVVIWLANRWRARDFGGRWDLWDTLIASWIASGFAVAAFAGIRGDEWRAAMDLVRYGSILWLLKRSRYPDRTWFELVAAICLGTVAGLGWGYYGLLVTKQDEFLALNSVGHVNHSSVYVATVLGVVLTAAPVCWRDARILGRAGFVALLCFLVASLFWTQSRAAVGAAFIAAFTLLAVHTGRRRGSLGLVALAAIGAVGISLLLSPRVVEKNTAFMQKSYLLNGREEIWRVGLAAWREFPIFGVGVGNFGRIDYKQLEVWSAKRGEAFEKQSFLPQSHGHSLYVNTLAERGLLGFAALFAILAAWVIALVRRVPAANAPPVVWIYWGGATGAWIITIVAGALNTTLHHELALLGMLLLGGWLSLSRSQPVPTA